MISTIKTAWHLLLLMCFSLVLFSSVLAQNNKGATVLDIDFTKGPGILPDSTTVKGGMWRNGWLVTENNQRIVLDPGYHIRNGVMEVTFTYWDTALNPTAFAEPALPKPTNAISIFEDAAIGKSGETNGDFFILRMSSNERYEDKQGNISVRMKGEGDQGVATWGQSFGKWADLTADDKTPMTIRLEWKDGKPVYTDVKGNVLSDSKAPTAPLDKLRYLVLGGNISLNNGSAVGMRFLRAKLVDLDKSPTSQPVVVRSKKSVVFDVDLTKGPDGLPAQAAVVGGQWDNGWRPLGSNQRLVFDPGYQIKNGILEVTFTRKEGKLTGPKVDVIGMFEEPSLDHSDRHGDTIVFRIGEAELESKVQGNIKAFAKERIPEHWGMVWEERLGKADDWTMDDKTPMKIKFEWKNGVVNFTDIKGNTMICPNNCHKQVDNLRYVALGGDRYNDGGTVLGMRFLSMKLIDLDVKDGGKPVANVTSK
jgi:hypothetical protein